MSTIKSYVVPHVTTAALLIIGFAWTLPVQSMPPEPTMVAGGAYGGRYVDHRHRHEATQPQEQAEFAAAGAGGQAGPVHHGPRHTYGGRATDHMNHSRSGEPAEFAAMGEGRESGAASRDMGPVPSYSGRRTDVMHRMH